MQVKRRLNQFFGNLLRKDKAQLQEDDEEQTSPSQVKNKQKSKNNQSYSQWDLIEHISGEPIEDGPLQQRKPNDENLIYCDGLALYSMETFEDLNDAHNQVPVDNCTEKKNRSFLKRSGSLLRKSLRRSKKKKSKNAENLSRTEWQESDQESLSNAVQEINNTLIAVAALTEKENGEDSCSKVKYPRVVGNSVAPSENDAGSTANCRDPNEIVIDNGFEHRYDEEWNQEERKVGLKNGLKRQASKLASKFQRTPGSVRLKSTASIESFPNAERNRCASFSANPITNQAHPDLADCIEHKRKESFKRKLSFKQARKTVRKGVASFGMSMIHASAVMPIAYESPPVNFYPDYNDEYPPHMVQCYYRTISYQPKDYNWNDKTGVQHSHYAKPTSFYQHGYCYNG